MKKELKAIGITLLIILLFIGLVMSLKYYPITSITIIMILFILMIYNSVRDEID